MGLETNNGISDTDKKLYAEARQQWMHLSDTTQSVATYVQREKEKIDPDTKDYYPKLRKLELLSFYNSIADGKGGELPEQANKVGHKNMLKALQGHSPSGQLLDSQKFAAERGMHDVLSDKARDRLFATPTHSNSLVSKSALLKMATSATAAFGAMSAAHAENPHMTTYEMAKVGAVAVAEQNIPGQAELNKGDNCGIVGSIVGWTAGLAAGAGVATVGTPTTSPLISVPMAIAMTGTVENAVTPAATAACHKIKSHFGM